MSAEDLPAGMSLFSEKNDEESSDDILSGIILIPQENDEAGAQDGGSENKYVMHEVMVEIVESGDEMKPEMTVLDEDAGPDVRTEETEVNKNIILDSDSVPDITLQKENVFMALDVDTTPDILSEETKEVNNIAIYNEDSAPVITLDQVDNVIEITVIDKDSAPDITLDQVGKVNASLILGKDSAPDIPAMEIEVVKDVNESMMSDKVPAPDTSNKVITQDINHIAEVTRIDKAIEDNEIFLPEHIDRHHEPSQTRPIIKERVMPPVGQKGSIQLFTEDTGPQLYTAKGPLVTRPIITRNLPTVFDNLPIHGNPRDSKNLNEFFSHKIREFVGDGLTDYEYKQLEDYCSAEQLKTGDELEMETNYPTTGVVDVKILEKFDTRNKSESTELCVVRRNKLRMEKDTKGLFIKKLKYRGVRNLPSTQEVYHLSPKKLSEDVPDIDLEPGKDILYRVRVYRPFVYSQTKDRFTRTRHSVFCYDILLTGRNKLSDLRDRFVCYNDFDMRVDVSNHPDLLPNTKAKDIFPSGMLFINNVFYVDTREGCVDYSETIREWARNKGLGDFPKRDMCDVRLQDLTLKLGYPEVYVHQGNCEHVFLFSEVRLLNPTDPLRLYNYPCTTAIAQNQTVYCTTCAEFSARWIVVGCLRVPFDPAFFCETCFRQYLYIDGQKIGEFKAYSYRGNALNILKPQ